MFRMLFNCGLRTSELLNLRVCDVDFTEKFLQFVTQNFTKAVWCLLRMPLQFRWLTI